MDPQLFQPVVQSGDLHDDRDIAARPDRDQQVRNPGAQDIHILIDQPGPVVLGRLVPHLQFNHQADAFRIAHTAHAVNAFHVDDPDPADLHVMLNDGGGQRIHDPFAAPADRDHVIRHHAVAALHEFQRRLALADPRRAGDQNAHAVTINRRPMNDRLGREFLGEKQNDAADHLVRAAARPQHGNPPAVAHVEKDIARTQAAREHERRNLKREHGFETVLELRRRELLHEMDFGVAQDLNAVVGEVFEVPAQGQARTVDVGDEHGPPDPLKPADDLELQRFRELVEKPGYGDAVFTVDREALGVHSSSTRMRNLLRT